LFSFIVIDTTNDRKLKKEGKSKVMHNTRETNVLKEKIIELKVTKKKTLVSKEVIHSSGLSHGGLLLKSPFRTGFQEER
jgi:hypothetical protein